jgi:hypothetical protein
MKLLLLIVKFMCLLLWSLCGQLLCTFCRTRFEKILSTNKDYVLSYLALVLGLLKGEPPNIGGNSFWAVKVSILNTLNPR